MNILMPQLGETVAEGKITKWFKSAGDAVKPGDNLFEIETDKVSMEVPATEAGILSEIRVPEGEVAPVGAVVGVIGDGSAVSPSAKSGSAVAQPPKVSGPASAPKRLRPHPRQHHRRRNSRSSSIPSSRYARPSAISDRRGCQVEFPSRRWRGGSPAKPASIFPA